MPDALGTADPDPSVAAISLDCHALRFWSPTFTEYGPHDWETSGSSAGAIKYLVRVISAIDLAVLTFRF